MGNGERESIPVLESPVDGAAEDTLAIAAQNWERKGREAEEEMTAKDWQKEDSSARAPAGSEPMDIGDEAATGAG